MRFTDELPMIPSNIKTVYFIHVPKTSGQSLTSKWKRFRMINMGHQFNIDWARRTTYEEGGYIGCKTKYWGKCNFKITPNLKFSIIRNPFDWLTSYYFHGEELTNNGKYCEAGWFSCNYTHGFKSFDEFIRAYCSDNFKWHMPLFKQFIYCQYFNDDGECVPDILIRFEHFNKGLEVLNKSLPQPIIKRHYKNKSVRKKYNYKHYYTPELIALVEKKCQRELELFKYDFNGPTDDSLFIIPDLKYDLKKDKIIV